jgi:hypothetical protein
VPELPELAELPESKEAEMKRQDTAARFVNQFDG